MTTALSTTAEPVFSFSCFGDPHPADVSTTSSASLSPASSPSTAACVHVTCAAASSKLAIFGYHSGALKIFDVSGNVLQTHGGRHQGPVADVALGSNADVVVSAGASDSRVVISVVFPDGVESSLAAVKGFFFRVRGILRVVAVDPEYGRPRSGERVAYGLDNGRVVLYTRGWFGGSTRTLSSGEGPIRAMAWKGSLLAWICGEGVKVFDTRVDHGVCVIEIPPIPEAFSSIWNKKTRNECASARLNSDTARTAPTESVKFDPSVEEEAPASHGKEKDTSSLSRKPRRQSAEKLGGMEEGPVALKTRDGEGSGTADDHISRPPGLQNEQRSEEAEFSQKTDSRSSDRLPGAYQSDAEYSKDEPGGDQSQEKQVSAGQNSSNENESPDKSKRRELAKHEEHLTPEAEKLPKAAREEVSNERTPTGANDVLQRFSFLGWYCPENATVSKFGESTLRLIVTVPWVCKVVEIGPHRTKTDRAHGSREISVPLTLTADSLTSFSNSCSTQFLLGAASFPTSISQDSLVMLTTSLVPSASEPLLHLVSGPFSSVHTFPKRISEHSLLVFVPGSPSIVLVTSTSPRLSEDIGSSELQQSETLSVRPLTLTERLEHLMENENYKAALELVQKVPPPSWRSSAVTPASVGDRFLDSLLSTSSYEQLAEELPRIITQTSPVSAVSPYEVTMSERSDRWIKWIGVLSERNCANLVIDTVPISNPRLPAEVYTSLLINVVNAEPSVAKNFRSLLQRYPLGIFAAEEVISAIKEQLANLKSTAEGENSEDVTALQDGLVALYEREGDDDGILSALLQMRSLRLFDHLRAKPRLYERILSKDRDLQSLFLTSSSMTANQLARAELPFTREEIIERIRLLANRKWLYDYLHALFRIDPGCISPLDDEYLELCVEFGSVAAVTAFVRGTDRYNVERALRIMDRRADLIGERVYMMKAVGDLDGVLEILMKEGRDVSEAVEFIEGPGAGDEILWNKLLEYAEKDSGVLGELLDRVGTAGVDGVRLVSMLKSSCKIQGLRDKLLRVVLDARLEKELRHACNLAVEADAYVLVRQLETEFTRAL